MCIKVAKWGKRDFAKTLSHFAYVHTSPRTLWGFYIYSGSTNNGTIDIRLHDENMFKFFVVAMHE